MNNRCSIDTAHSKRTSRFSSQEDYQAIQELRNLWQESEAVLGFLRTVGNQVEEPDSDLLKSWSKRCVPLAPASSFARQPDIHTPNGYFQDRFPLAVARYGKPFLQKEDTDKEGFVHTELLAPLNDLFFASVVGGDKRLGHQVICDKKSWWFFDPARQLWVGTTEAKLCLLLSSEMMKCAQSVGKFVDVRRLFGEFRSDDSLLRIVKTARAMHAAGEDFFENEKNVRIDAPATQVVPRLFVQEGLMPRPKSALTLSDCQERLSHFCAARSLPTLDRKEFPTVVEAIRDEYGLNLRHDVQGPNGRSQRGWVGLSCREGIILAN